jgi:excisionase family DNA binding protein
VTIENLATHPKPYVSPEELADYWDVSRRTVYLWIDKGAIHAVKIGALLKIPVENARAFGRPAREYAD